MNMWFPLRGFSFFAGGFWNATPAIAEGLLYHKHFSPLWTDKPHSLHVL